MRRFSWTGVVLLAVWGLPSRGRADVSHVTHNRDDQRGGVVHAVPLDNNQVRMVGERVVLVPYYDAKHWQPRLLCHVWYDLRNEGQRARLQVGFPELKAFYRLHQLYDLAGIKLTQKVEQHWKLPTIQAFSAWEGQRFFPVRSYPGLGRYRQWYTFGLELGAGQQLRLHNTYLATLGSSAFTLDPEVDDSGTVTSYFLQYVLHTGARWRGAIGQGEIFVYSDGRRRLVRQWKDLEPTVKDDVSLSVDVTAVLPHKGKPEEVGPGMFAHRRPAGTRLDRLRLVDASSTLASEQVDTHVGLVVDGDSETQWVSASGKAVGAHVQLPSDPGRDLTGLSVIGGRVGPGRVRPSKVSVYCLAGWRRTLLASADLPDAPGPQVVTAAKPVRCQAVRLEIQAVHGDRGASVAIAEVEQRFGTQDSPGVLAPGQRRTDPLEKPERGPGSGKVPLPAAEDPRAFEMTGIDEVSWSADGSLVHYRLYLEDLRQRARGVRLGYFADVATGKVVRAYRIDREGELPEPYRRHWEQAMTHEEGVAVLAKHGFQPAKVSRWPPRKPTLAGQRLALVGTSKDEARALVVVPARDGFTWRYSPRSTKLTGLSAAALELRYGEQGQPERVLTSRTPRIDRAFAGRHVTVWQGRKEIFAEAAQEYVKAVKQAGHSTEVTEEGGVKWHLLTYRNYQAYRGAARVFWHPRGEALLVSWSDHQDHSGAAPDPKPEEITPECAELLQKVCPWERLDDDRTLLAVTVHALVPRQPTTLLAAYQPPIAPVAPAMAALTPGSSGSSGSPGSSAAMPKARQGADPKAAPAKKRGGCSCDAASRPGAPGTALLLPLLGLCLLLGHAARAHRARAARVTGMASRSKPLGSDLTAQRDVVVRVREKRNRSTLAPPRNPKTIAALTTPSPIGTLFSAALAHRFIVRALCLLAPAAVLLSGCGSGRTKRQPSCDNLTYCQCIARRDCRPTSKGCLCPCEHRCPGYESCNCACGGGKYLGCTAAKAEARPSARIGANEARPSAGETARPSAGETARPVPVVRGAPAPTLVGDGPPPRRADPASRVKGGTDGVGTRRTRDYGDKCKEHSDCPADGGCHSGRCIQYPK